MSGAPEVHPDPERLWTVTADVTYTIDGEEAAVNHVTGLLILADDRLDAAQQAAAIVHAVTAQLVVLEDVAVTVESHVDLRAFPGSRPSHFVTRPDGTTKEV